MLTFIPRTLLPLRGRLALTHCPRSSLARLEDELGSLKAAGVEVLANLLSDEDMALNDVPNLIPRAEGLGLRVLRYPIPDHGVPEDKESFRAFVAQLLAELEAGFTIVVHCRAGLGRSGMVAACCLVAAGLAWTEAIAEVRRVRPGAVETKSQEELVMNFARSHGRQT